MHVLYLHQYFVPPDGPGATRSYEMARRMVRAGHRVTLITSTAMFPEQYRFDRSVTKLDIEGIDVRALRVPYANRMSYRKRVAAFAKFAALSAAEALRTDRPDVIFATSTPLTIALPGIVARLWHRRPMVFEVRDLWPELPIAMGALRNPIARLAARALEHLAYRSAREIVALSPGMKDGIVRAGYPSQSVTVIPNGSDIELFRSSVAQDVNLPFDDDGRPLIMYAGTLGAINDVDYLVTLAASARRLAPECRFLIVGDGATRDKLVDYATTLGVLGVNLWMIPPVPKRAIPALFARSTVSASLFADLPQMWNNSANKFFDALAAGRPVLINYGGWQAKLLQESGAGLVVPSRDPDEAARMLHAFLTEPGAIQRASVAAAELAEERFNRNQLASQLIDVLTRASR